MKKSSTMTYAITGDPAFCTLRRMFSLFFRMRVVYYTKAPASANVPARALQPSSKARST